MTRAAIEAYEGDSSRMASLIRAGLRDMDREYALDLATAVAGDKAHIVMAIRGETYEGIVPPYANQRAVCCDWPSGQNPVSARCSGASGQGSRCTEACEYAPA
ncbi:hypothetical protein G6F62_015487 [Rhizopus arrhizus]|nr:hypothetical protein G6F62_015487 [Rhizopus arrhizus]